MSAYPSMAKFRTINGKRTITNYNQVFKNITVLGEGGNGVVWKVQDTRSGKYYALKQIDDYDDDTIREINVLRTLSDAFGDSVVKYYDYFFYQNKLSILMEFIQGFTVNEFFRRGFTLDNFIDFAIWLTDIVAKLHAKNYVHRDIKPDNILITHGKYKLIDFGYSCRLGKPIDKLSCKLSSPGTPYYVAPEIYTREYEKNMMKYYKSADVYASGVTLYHLLTRHFPYQLKQRIAIMSPYKPISVRNVNTKISNDINYNIYKMVAIDVNERFTARQANQKFRTIKREM